MRIKGGSGQEPDCLGSNSGSAMGHWGNDLTSLCLCLLICKIWIKKVPPSHGGWGLNELITIKDFAYFLSSYIVIIHDVLILAQRLDAGHRSQEAGV